MKKKKAARKLSGAVAQLQAMSPADRSAYQRAVAARISPEDRSETARKAAQTMAADPARLREKQRRERVTKAQKYIGANLVLTGTSASRSTVVTIPVDELASLNIDESYQRSEIKHWVGKLIAVLLAGGEIPDPIKVAVRPDKSRWIVDGQQRFWAHFHCLKPLRAILIDVPDIATERTLFSVLNAKVALQAAARVKTWPGPGAELVRQLDLDHNSALRERVSWGSTSSTTTGGRQQRVSASQLSQAILLCLTGAKPTADKPEDLLPKLDDLARQNLPRAHTAAHGFASEYEKLMTARGASLPRSHIYGFALACYRKWTTVHFPALSRPDVGRLTRMNWTNYAPDARAHFIPLLADEIARRWHGNGNGDDGE